MRVRKITGVRLSAREGAPRGPKRARTYLCDDAGKILIVVIIAINTLSLVGWYLAVVVGQVQRGLNLR